MITLLITHYNQFKELDLVIQSIKRQRLRDFEIMIADDGSDKKLLDARIVKYSELLQKDITLVWHNDQWILKTFNFLNKVVHENSAGDRK